MAKVSVKDERFCQLYVKYGSKIRAYLESRDKDYSESAGRYVRADEISNKPEVKARIKEIRMQTT